MTFKISLSKLFNEQLREVAELDTNINLKKLTQNIKATVKCLERMQKSGITIQDMKMNAVVPGTKYSIMYNIKTNPSDKLIVKKILRHR